MSAKSTFKDRCRRATPARVIALVALVWWPGAAHGQVRLGPVFDHFRLTLEPGERTEAAGPFYYRESSGTNTTVAVPPFFSLAENAEVEAREWDFLYPAVTFDRYGAEYRLQFGQLLSFTGGGTQEEQQARRFTLFPFYFQQRGLEPEENYTALLPFYGTLRHRLFRDEIHFILWPLYVETRKKDVVTENYVYPFFHLRHGDGLQGWQALPLAGVEHKDVTTRTNGFGDLETIAGHDKLSLLWPFFFLNTTGIGTPDQGQALGVLPLYATSRSPARDSTSVVWPFFNIIDDRAKDYREWQAPWPFIQVARGEGKHMTRVWPVFGTARTATLESDFALWPLYRFNRFHAETLVIERTQVLFWVYSDSTERNTQAGTERRRTDLWPLFTASRDADGRERFQILAPIEPVLRNNKSIERNWSPLWSLWRAEKNPRTGEQSQSFLWNLYRTDTGTNSKNVSLLFGLFQYDSNPVTTRWRLFHVPVASHQTLGTTSR